VNPAIGLPRRHVNTLLPYVATRLFSRTCDGCLVADKIFTKDFNPYDRAIKVPDHGFSFANTYPFTDSPIGSESNFTYIANSLLTSSTMCFHIKRLEN
jgi:hypothetical protein